MILLNGRLWLYFKQKAFKQHILSLGLDWNTPLLSLKWKFLCKSFLQYKKSEYLTISSLPMLVMCICETVQLTTPPVFVYTVGTLNHHNISAQY